MLAPPRHRLTSIRRIRSHPFLNRLLLVFVLTAFATACSGVRPLAVDSSSPFSVLVFTKTEGFRHDSTDESVAALRTLGTRNGFDVTATEDAALFTAESLRRHQAVVFLNTSGDVLDAAQKAAFEEYVRSGGGFVGVHGAAATQYEWEWYGELVGAFFDDHPDVQEADVHVLDPAHPATRHLPRRWTWTDEWYNFRTNPRGKVHVLATVGEKTYEGGTMGHDHPIVWAHEFDGGRSFYTGLGHTAESYMDPLFLEHLLGGIRWAAGVEDADVGATVAGSFERVVLETRTTYPMQLEVAPDGRVFWIERDGSVKIWDPESETTYMAAYVPVTMKIEDGLLGIALDPDFEENQWVYLYYTPISEDPNRLSRFTMRGNHLDLTSEIIVLEVPMQRERCCHSAGELAFGPNGTLFLSTGDNTGGSAPRTDERPGREHFDAQRTTANTNDLRGKILRIRPEPDGSYSIPEGNLFEEGDPLARPEVYTMGHRNPWRIAVDPRNGWVYSGDVGPGNQYAEGRMPLGQEEFNLAKGPGFFGWPYFVAANEPYRDYDYETEEHGAWPDPERPVNDSPNNTGRRILPPAQPAWIWYSYGPSEEFPEMGTGGMSASAGFVYYHDPETVGPYGLPPYYDGKVFLFEWMRNWIHEVTLDADGSPMEITPFTPEIPFIRPIDVALGPDGRMYVLEWGTEFWGENRDGRLVRLDYHGTPARRSRRAASGTSHSAAVDSSVPSPSGSGAGELIATSQSGFGDSIVPSPSRSLGSAGSSRDDADPEPRAPIAYAQPSVRTSAADVSIVWPPNGGFFQFDASVPYEVDAKDREGRSVTEPAPRVTVQPYLGHDTHTHRLHAHRGRTGFFVVVPDFTHTPYVVDHFVEVEATYREPATAGTDAVVVRDRVLLRPSVVQAENHTTASGARQVITANRQRPTFAEETEVFMQMSHEGHVSFSPVNLYGIDGLVLRLQAMRSGIVEVRLGGPDGRLLAEAPLTPLGQAPAGGDPAARTVEEQEDLAARQDPTQDTGGWAYVHVPVTDPGGTHELTFVFRGEGQGDLARFDQIEFQGSGVMVRRDHAPTIVF